MKKLVFALAALASFSSFAGGDYLCKAAKGNSRAVLAVEQNDSTYRLYDLYRAVNYSSDYSRQIYSETYESVSHYFGDDMTYNVKSTGNGLEFYTTVPGLFGMGTKEVTQFEITRNGMGVAEACSSGLIRGNDCWKTYYKCEGISAAQADAYVDML